MLKYISFIFLTFISSSIKSQSIYSALHLNEERSYKNKRPKIIVKTNTFYNSSGKKTLKEITSFDESGMFLSEDRFDEDGIKTVGLSHINDTINRIVLESSFERWTTFGYSKEITYFEYDSTKFLIRITKKDDKGKIINLTEIINNEKGHPIELEVFDLNGNSPGKEIAKYFYETNQYVSSVLRNEDILSTDTGLISYKNAYLFPTDRNQFNDKGDQIKWVSRSFNGKETSFEEEYTYDQYGNCTENRIYKVIYKTNGKSKREIDRIFKNQYKY